MDAAIGDHFVIKGNKIGRPRRRGEVVEALGPLFSSRQHFRVRWDDGHESIFVPGPGVTIEHAQSNGRRHRSTERSFARVHPRKA